MNQNLTDNCPLPDDVICELSLYFYGQVKLEFLVGNV